MAANAKPFLAKRVILFAWDLYKVHSFFLIIFFVFLTAISLGTQFIADVLIREVSIASGLMVLVVGWIFGILLDMGLLYIILRIIRKRKVNHEDILTPAPYVLRYIAASALHTAIVLFGFLLFIIPGIIWSIRYGFFRYLIVDGCTDPIRALYVSARITRGHTWRLFCFACLMALFNLLGILAFGVGLLVTVPLTALAMARVYDRLLAGTRINFSE